MLVNQLEQIGHGVAFGVRGTLAIPSVLIRPRFWVRLFVQVFLGSAPLGIILGVALGAVVWMQARGVLQRVAGATDLLPTVLAAAVLLELAPVGAGLILAARVGAMLGAELAAMNQTEQIDALKLLGVSPQHRVVAPRILICCWAAPLLFCVVSCCALTCSYLAEAVLSATPWLKYRSAVLQELYLSDVLPAFLKTFLFGWLVGVGGCWVGLNAHGGAEGVGRAATSAVVLCSALVLAADVLFLAAQQLFRSIS